jgi:hypothetical protein
MEPEHTLHAHRHRHRHDHRSRGHRALQPAETITTIGLVPFIDLPIDQLGASHVVDRVVVLIADAGHEIARS